MLKGKFLLSYLTTAAQRAAGGSSIFRIAIVAGVLLAAIFIVAAIFIAVARPFILSEVVIPIARRHAPGGVVPMDIMDTLNGILVRLAPALGIISVFALLVPIVIERLYRRLPTTEIGVPSPQRTLPLGRGEFLLLVALSLLAIGLRLPGISRGFEYDEIYTAIKFVEVPSLWATISTYHIFNNHIGYSVLAWICHAIFGRHEWVLRLPAMLMGLGGVVAIWWFARAEISSAIGLIAALCLAVLPMHVQYSVTARGYTGAALFTVVATGLFLRLLKCPNKKNSILLAVSGALAIWMHLYSALAIGVLVIYVVVMAARNPRNISAGAFRMLAIAFTALVALATFFHAAVLLKIFYTIAIRGRGEFNPLFPIEILRDFGGQSLTFAVGATLLFAVGIFSLGTDQRHRRVCWLVASLFVIPLLITCSFHPLDLFTRFFFFYLPFYAMAIAAGCIWIWRFAGSGRAIVATRGTLVIAFAIAVGVLARNAVRDVPEEGFRRVACAMMKNVPPGTSLCSIGAGGELLAYYIKDPLLLPETFDALHAETDNKAEVRCAYRERSWTTAEHRRAATWLATQGTLQSYGDFVIYTLRRPPH